MRHYSTMWKRLVTTMLLGVCARQLPASEVPVTPEIAGVVAAGTPIELLGEGFQGTEGPVAMPDGSVLFTEAQGKRITRIAPDGTVSAFLENAGVANALALGAGGELIATLIGKPAVAIVHPPERARVLADRFEDTPFARPNDLVIDAAGGVYFTDPMRAEAGKPPRPNPVYYLAPGGELSRIAIDIALPNGIQLSPSGKVLYIADSAGEYVLAYDIVRAGVIGPRRNFAKVGAASGADGLAVDGAGRLYAATATGVQVFSDAGVSLGTLAIPKTPQNLAFGGPDKRTLYVVGRGSVWRIAMLARGYAGRAK
jgi:gluconolactonase